MLNSFYTLISFKGLYLIIGLIVALLLITGSIKTPVFAISSTGVKTVGSSSTGGAADFFLLSFGGGAVWVGFRTSFFLSSYFTALSVVSGSF